MISLFTSKGARLVQRVFVSVIRKPEQVLVKIAGVSEHDASVSVLKTTLL